ncbi:interferon-induced protein with tetratricopeptide repeats 1B-like [Callorhinchus milii]|uniref:interferon-induced protein with tetratricopeptide repeats 1B-like n=1 Tax=Callorhinchus milii TaxID=7868 RepID=UPI001C3FBEB9|nr:interferon-induced protein with tetratricopeptide repeats 1B-like [Callorhinchus milii]
MSNTSKDSLKEKLLQLECHFTWSVKKEMFDLDDAKQRLEELIIDGIKYQAMPYNYLAFINCLQDNYGEALEALQKAEEILRKNHEHDFERRSIITYGNYAWVYYYMDQLTDVQTYLDKLERICKLFPNASRHSVMTPEIYGEKGWALLNCTGICYEEAKECFLKALEEDPDDTEWNMGYATVLFRLESFLGTAENLAPSKAIPQLRRVLELDPNDSIAMVLLALKLREVNEVNEGFTLVEKALKISPNRPYVIRYAAKFLRKARAIDKAVELLKRAMTITPDSSFLHHQIGLCYRVKLIDLMKYPGIRNAEFEARTELIELCKSHFEKAFLLKNHLFLHKWTSQKCV